MSTIDDSPSGLDARFEAAKLVVSGAVGV